MTTNDYTLATRRRSDDGPDDGNHPVPGAPLSWIDITSDGTERIRIGRVWSCAPPVPGRGRAYWVLPSDRPKDEATREPSAVLVTIVNRRHRVGARHLSRFIPIGGRYVDIGERYRETDRASRTRIYERHASIATAPPRSISSAPTTPTARTEYENWLRTIASLSDTNQEAIA